MALNTTPGDASAESYATVAELDSYAATRLPAIAWYATANTTQKENALRAGARELDSNFNWTGAPVDEVQAMCWPRLGMLNRNGFLVPSTGGTSIPSPLKNAQCEFALQLGAADRLGDNDPLKKGITMLKAGSVELRFSDTQGSKAANYDAADIDIRKQQSDLNYVSNAVPDEVRRLLVGSWYVQNSIRRPLLFETN